MAKIKHTPKFLELIYGDDKERIDEVIKVLVELGMWKDDD